MTEECEYDPARLAGSSFLRQRKRAQGAIR